MVPSLRLPLALTLIAVLALLSAPAASWAQDVVEIEEHWELTVGRPDTNRCAPQVTLVMSPENGMENDYFLFLLNYSSIPEFSAGGVQLQHWKGAQVVATAGSTSVAVLRYEQEKITWTQKLRIEDGLLTLDIDDGQSQTWGSFGESGILRFSVPTTLTRLNDYQPRISIEESGIGFAGNRVSSLVLRKLVWTTSDGEVHELVSPIDIDTDIDP